MRFVRTEAVGELAFVERALVEQEIEAAGVSLDRLERERLDAALRWVQQERFERALAVLEVSAPRIDTPALLANRAALRLAVGEVQSGAAALADVRARIEAEATAVRTALDFNARRVAAQRDLPEGWLSLPLPADRPALSARLARFADTGGMLTAEVVFANLSDDAVRFCPPLERSRLIDEPVGEASAAVLYLVSDCPVELRPAEEWRAWVKFARPLGEGPFTLDFAGVNRAIDGLALP